MLVGQLSQSHQIIMSHNIKLGAFQLSWAAAEGREDLILFMILFIFRISAGRRKLLWQSKEISWLGFSCKIPLLPPLSRYFM